MSTPPQLYDSEAETRFFYSDEQNQPVGPFPLSELHRLAANGTISRETYVIEEQGAEWKPYASLLHSSQSESQGATNPPIAGQTRHAGFPFKALLLFLVCAPVGIFVFVRNRKFTKLTKIGSCIFGALFIAPLQLAFALTLLSSAMQSVVDGKRNSSKNSSGESATRAIDNSTRFIPSGTSMFSDEQAVQQIEESPEDRARPEKERQNAAFGRFESLQRDGRVWREWFGFSVRILKADPSEHALFVEPLEKEVTRLSQFWVSESDLRKMDDPEAQIWASLRKVSRKDFAAVLRGSDKAMAGRTRVSTFEDAIAGIYAGRIPVEVARHYLFAQKAKFTELENVVGEYLIFKIVLVRESYLGGTPEESVEFAVRRNIEIERLSPNFRVERIGHAPMRNPFTNYEGIVVTETSEFTTGAGLIKVVPVAEFVRMSP